MNSPKCGSVAKLLSAGGVFCTLYSKAIYALSLSNSSSTEFYRVNHIIDGMTLHNGKLYWTDSLVGRIASLDINAARRQHQVLKPGLSKPRAIVVTNRCDLVVWTKRESV